MTSRPKIILLLAVLMILSGLAGTCIGTRIGRAQARKRTIPEAWNVEAMRTLQRKLSLNPDQALKVKEVLDSGLDDLRAIRTDTLARTDKVINRLVGQIEPVLTEEQRPEFHRLVEERAQASLEMLNITTPIDAKKPKP